MTTPPTAETISQLGAVTGVLGTILAAIVGALTFRQTRAGVRGDDWDRLAGTLSTWSERTIADLQTRINQAETECRDRLAESEDRWAERFRQEKERTDYWRRRALGFSVKDDTPPPEARR